MFSVIGYLPIDEGGDGRRVWRFELRERKMKRQKGRTRREITVAKGSFRMRRNRMMDRLW